MRQASGIGNNNIFNVGQVFLNGAEPEDEAEVPNNNEETKAQQPPADEFTW